MSEFEIGKEYYERGTISAEEYIDHYLEQQLAEQSEALKETQAKLDKAVACIDETLAIIAHIDPDTYNNREALTMVGSVNMKTLKGIKE